MPPRTATVPAEHGDRHPPRLDHRPTGPDGESTDEQYFEIQNLVDTALTPDFDAAAMEAMKAISPEDVADAVIKGMQDDKNVIRIGRVKLLEIASRIAPHTTDRLVNAEIDKVRHSKDDE